jgi:hypothetical protein
LAVPQWNLERINKLQFQVNGKDYFLAFVEDEKRWYVFAPTPQGVQRIPVYVDAPNYSRMAASQEKSSDTNLSS